MTTDHIATSCIQNPRINAVIKKLYADTLRVDPIVRQTAHQQGLTADTAQGFYQAMREAYMPVTPDLGALLYLLVRSASVRSIVEYGMSFGISTLFLAAALRDNGGGRIITTEIEEHKAQRARSNLIDAGLEDLVEIRIGDAIQTLSRNLPDIIDFVLLDGLKSDYLSILKLLEPKLRNGAIVSADNSDMSGVHPFLEYIRDPRNGYITSALFTNALGAYHGNQIAMRNHCSVHKT